MTRLHYIQHVPFETPGSILDWAAANGTRLSHSRLYDKDPLPDPEMFDMLVVMGGPMGVYDEDKFSWLADEKSFIGESIKAGKAIIGICLGAQLIASALGSKISKNRYKEIGWYPVRTTPESGNLDIISFLPHQFTTLHWHGDTFDLPANAVRIAVSDGCDNQGFLFGDRVLGLQFHLEVTEHSFDEMLENGRHELVKDKFVQGEKDILNGREFIKANNKYISDILTNLVRIL